MSHTLTELRHALDWLKDSADLDNAGDAQAAAVLAQLIAEALDGYYETAQQASDYSVAAGLASFGHEIGF